MKGFFIFSSKFSRTLRYSTFSRLLRMLYAAILKKDSRLDYNKISSRNTEW